MNNMSFINWYTKIYLKEFSEKYEFNSRKEILEYFLENIETNGIDKINYLAEEFFNYKLKRMKRK